MGSQPALTTPREIEDCFEEAAYKFLPANTISNTLRDAMLVRGLVTPERLRARGVH